MFNYKQRILIPLIIAAALLCISMGGLFVAMYQLVDYSEQKDLVDRQRYQVVALSKAITNAENGQRGYLLTGHTLFLDALEQGQAEAMKEISLLEHDLNKSSAAHPLLSKIKQLVQQKFTAMDKSVQVQMHAGEYAPHLSLSRDRGRELMKLIDGHLAQIDEQLMIQRQGFEQAIRNRILASVTVAIILSIVIISVLVFSYRSTTLLLEQVMENQAVAKQLSHQADHDLLTGLPNRRSVNMYLENTYDMARIGSKQFAVFFMDLDGFKRVNDAYGHDVGDALLIEVANMFKKVLRQSDFLARQGGDEFVLVVSHYLYRLELTQLAQRLIHLFTQPVVVRGIPLEIGVSIGIAEFPHHGKNVKQLLHVADKAMYDSKKNGKNRYSFGA
ncbi:diguanylate cyclase domain-containing protein [Methylophilus sp. 3sh_L]|uniref:diguanylate cyclase domain-containing protein n=1 Tax=Methylophilus sp. 3sh_L TaxID=3377114 RepID=UPI00398E51C1